MEKISVTLTDIAEQLDSHAHAYAQMIIPLDSAIYIHAQGREYVIDNKTFTYIPPDCTHAFRSEAGRKVLLINIPECMIKKTDIEKLQAADKFLIDSKISLLIDLMLQEISDYPESSSVQYLFYYLYDKIVERNKSQSIEYIRQCYAEDIALHTLAAIEHYNVNYYPEWFRKQTGMTPKEYIQRLRVEKAKELLMTTKYSISAIAGQVGYTYSSSFCRVFKMLEGISPTTYRNLN